jgi:hypothetical protein
MHCTAVTLIMHAEQVMPIFRQAQLEATERFSQFCSALKQVVAVCAHYEVKYLTMYSNVQSIVTLVVRGMFDLVSSRNHKHCCYMTHVHQRKGYLLCQAKRAKDTI